MSNQQSAVVELSYNTSAGPGAAFRTDTRQLIRLEPGLDCVRVGWTVDEPFQKLAPLLGRMAADPKDEVYLAYNHDAHHPTERGAKLVSHLAQLVGVQLMRVDRAADSIVWEVVTQEPKAELSVATATWEDAGRLALELEAPEIAEVLPKLLAQMPQIH